MTAMMAACVMASPVRAQPADLPIPAATTSDYPAGIRVGSAGGVPVYVDQAGHTLYGMDMRTLLRAGADTSKYCQADCAQRWEPMLAPAGSKPNIMFPRGFGDRQRQQTAAGGAAAAPSSGAAAAGTEFVQNQKAPDWTIIEGPQGPQWVYKGWHMVYVRKGEAPGSATHDGDENMVWNTLKYVPPVPKLTAPVNVSTAFVAGAYALVDSEGRLLFTGDCSGDCADWRPLSGGMASHGLGDWAVSLEADKPQWLYRGKPVFVAAGPTPDDMPAGAAVLRP
jgi:predicted lipoprotein with Yx(FWY)xxD motif